MGFDGMWIPTHIVHDAESDDSLCWLLLEYIRRLKGSTSPTSPTSPTGTTTPTSPTSQQLKVMVQVPDEDKFDAFIARCIAISSKSGSTCECFRDPDSKNAVPVTKHW